MTKLPLCEKHAKELRDTIDNPPLYYDRTGKPISLRAWVDAWDQPEYRQVEEDFIDGARVSTMWMGTDHSFGHAPKPIIFGSAIFRAGKMVEEIETATEFEARIAHQVLCRKLRGED